MCYNCISFLGMFLQGSEQYTKTVINILVELLKVWFTGIGVKPYSTVSSIDVQVACLNTPTLPNHAHPRDFNENKLIVQKKCYYVLKGCKRHYLVKNGKIPLSTFVSISI